MSSYFHSLALLSTIFFLHLVSLSYGQTPDEEEDPVTTRKRPILRKIVILVGLLIGFAALCWALHKTYKAYCRWSQKRRRLIGRNEFDAMMEDLEKQEKDSNTSASKEDQASRSPATGKYMPLNSASGEEEPLMTDAGGSHEKAPQHVSENAKQTGEVSTPLLYDVPLDDSEPLDDRKINVTEQVRVRDHSLEPSVLPEEERETQA